MDDLSWLENPSYEGTIKYLEAENMHHKASLESSKDDIEALVREIQAARPEENNSGGARYRGYEYFEEFGDEDLHLYYRLV